tara:strand:+ start:1471 stop:2574 length:1104 start_codon:yes stop_codon:yes gene_type:complete
MALSKIQTAEMLDAPNLGRRNLVINGAMQVSQRGTSFTGHGAGVNYGIDRFFDFHNSDGAFTLSQETSVVPVGFSNALKIQTTTADSSIAAGQRLIVGTRMEGLNVAHLNWGTSNAKTVTLSFYVRSSVTGTHGGAIGNGSDNRNYPFTYTISSADTWERKSITVAGDTTGTWETGIGRSIQVTWGLGVGSTYSGSAGAWAAGDKNSATGATTAVLGTLNATWYLTGVQLEVGSVATDFEQRSYGEELSLCSRYYHTSFSGQTTIGGSHPSLYSGKVFSWCDHYGSSPDRVAFNYQWPVQMRDIPTVTMYGNQWTSGRVSRYNGGNNEYTIDYASGVSKNGLGGYYDVASGATGDFVVVYVEAQSEL